MHVLNLSLIKILAPNLSLHITMHVRSLSLTMILVQSLSHHIMLHVRSLSPITNLATNLNLNRRKKLRNTFDLKNPSSFLGPRGVIILTRTKKNSYASQPRFSSSIVNHRRLMSNTYNPRYTKKLLDQCQPSPKNQNLLPWTFQTSKVIPSKNRLSQTEELAVKEVTQMNTSLLLQWVTNGRMNVDTTIQSIDVMNQFEKAVTTARTTIIDQKETRDARDLLQTEKAGDKTMTLVIGIIQSPVMTRDTMNTGIDIVLNQKLYRSIALSCQTPTASLRVNKALSIGLTKILVTAANQCLSQSPNPRKEGGKGDIQLTIRMLRNI